MSRSDGDPHANEDKARKAARAEIFSTWLIETYGIDKLNTGSGVLDVAGGRGEVSFHLFTKCGIKCTLVDPRPRKLSRI